MNRLSVLVLISYRVFPAAMGGQKCVEGFYTTLSQHCRLTLAVEKNNVTDTVGNAAVLPILFHHRKGFLNLLRIYALYQLIRTEKTDLVIIEHSYFGWLGLLLKWLTRTPFVIRSHNIEAYRFRDMRKWYWQPYLIYEKYVHRKAGHSFFITAEEMNQAISTWQLDTTKCSVVPYGICRKEPLTDPLRMQYRMELLAEYRLPSQTRLFLFNGTLDYLPNTDALRIILNELIPRLSASPIAYRIFICGRGTTEQWKKVLARQPEIIFCDFVPDISRYFKGADCFINPVTLGSGIKIKLVDALSYNQHAISTRSGAKGIPEDLAIAGLLLVNDYDWNGFADAMLRCTATGTEPVPAGFYQFFHQDNIVQKALLSLQTLCTKN